MDIRDTIQRHWASANARQWDSFAELLAPGLRYEVPQTREYIDSSAGYLDLFVTWPGDWHAEIERLVCEGARAVCVIRFTVGGEAMTGISCFELDGEGRIATVTDYWPEPYEPPPRASAHMKRRPPPES